MSGAGLQFGPCQRLIAKTSIYRRAATDGGVAVFEKIGGGADVLEFNHVVYPVTHGV